MIFAMAFKPNSLKPSVQIIALDSKNEFNYALLLSSINMTSGLFCFKDSLKEFKIHCVDDKYFENFSLDNFIKTVSSVNDDDSI